MSSNSVPFFVLRFRYRSVAVFRDQLHTLEDVIKLARATFPALESVPTEDVTIAAILPQYPNAGTVEISDRVWPIILPGVSKVEIYLKASGETET